MNLSSKRPKSQVRILLCLTSLDLGLGGIAAVNRTVVRALQSVADNGLEMELRALLYHGRDLQFAGSYFENIRPFPVEACYSNRWRFLLRYAWTCLHWRPALVFVDHLHVAVVPYLWSWLVTSPYVVFCHGTEFDEKLSALRKRAFRAAAQRLGNSQFTARRVGGLFPDVPVETCELGLEELNEAVHEEVRVLPDAFGVPQQLGKRVVLIVSRLWAAERYKGHDQLLAFMPALVEQIADAQLVIAGAGDDRERLQRLARESGAGQAILFSGFVSAGVLATLYSRCRLFAMPSRGEGFGLVYLEAMRFAKPCIASWLDAGGEVVADGVSGILVDPANLKEFRAAVARLLCDDELAGRYGQAGLERLNRQYRFRHFQHRLRTRLAQLIPELAIAGLAGELDAARHPRAIE